MASLCNTHSHNTFRATTQMHKYSTYNIQPEPQTLTQQTSDSSQNIIYTDKSTSLLSNQTKIMYKNPEPFCSKNNDDFITVISRKRYRSSREPKTRYKQTRISNYWLSAPVPTSNRFESLSSETEKDDETVENQEKLLKPPPIFVDGVSNITPLTQLLEKIAKEE